MLNNDKRQLTKTRITSFKFKIVYLRAFLVFGIALRALVASIAAFGGSGIKYLILAYLIPAYQKRGRSPRKREG
jgi:uncharacterized membrane protein YGL010W